MTTGVLVLAAGRARRFGSDKREARLGDGRRVIDAMLANVAASGLPLLVCVGENDHCLADCLQARAISYQRCVTAQEGMGATLAEGVGQVQHWSGVLIALADMPWVAPETYAVVAQQVSADRIAVPVYDGRRGHPVGFGCEFYSELRALRGDSGARSVLLNNARYVTEVVVPDAAIHCDIDVPNDVAGR